MWAGCFFLLTLPLQILANGFVISKLWEWFIVPLGVQNITIAWALGFSTFVGLFQSHNLFSGNNIENPKEKVITAISIAISRPLVALGFGYLWHCFMPM
jgi:hypothetical protein